MTHGSMFLIFYALITLFFRLDASLRRVEKKRGIRRWPQKSTQLQRFLKEACKAERVNELASVHKSVVEYRFMESLMRKYASKLILFISKLYSFLHYK